MKRTLLFEIGTEEIPAWMIPPALVQLKTRFETLLGEADLAFEALAVFSTPRRLALLAEGLPDRQSDREELIVGPPKSAALREDGSPGPAGQGFARKMGVGFESLELVETEKGEYLALRRRVKGRPARELLAEILPALVASIQWPKNMYWRESRFRFIRPLRWFVALLDEEVVDFEFEGVRSGRETRGHRFLGESRLSISRPGEYLEVLRENSVLADVEERRVRILDELRANLPEGHQLVEDPGLQEEVVHLNEFPSVLRGEFDPDFLRIPQEVLITVMRHHQKYFSLLDREERLQPGFFTVLNTVPDSEGRIRAGHEKVLRARLEDGAFFWDNDRKTPLRERLPLLEQILFQEKLGSYGDKTRRILDLCIRLAEGDDSLETAARLSKADLTTDMVREFSELQGVMGGLYAREEGYSEEVWRAVYEHYRPLSLEDASPETLRGALLSTADRLDTITGCFGIGIVSTGSSDPFALRRQAQGLIKILLDHRLDFGLEELVDLALRDFEFERPKDEIRLEILEFLEGRLRHVLREGGAGYDVVNAVLACGVDRVHSALARVEALSRIRGESDFEALAVSFKRIQNILSSQTVPRREIDAERLTDPEEVALYQALRELIPRVEEALEGQDYVGALRRIAGLRATVDRFFDKVLVMAPESELRENRLCLLENISRLFLRIADISRIVPAERKE